MSDDYYWTDTGSKIDADEDAKAFYSEHESGWSVHYDFRCSEFQIQDPVNHLIEDGFTSMETAKDFVEMLLGNASATEPLCFLAWAEKTHPAYLNNLKEGYRRYKEASQ